MKKKELKRKAYLESKHQKVEQERRVMELEKTVSILKREVCKSKEFKRPSHLMKSSSIKQTVSILKQQQNKSFSLVRNFKHRIPIFQKCDVRFHREELGSGVFGTVRLGFISSVQQKVAVKTFSKSLTQTDIRAEAMIALEMSGHPNFPYTFGMIEPNMLLMELVQGNIHSLTLHDIVSNDVSFRHLKSVCLDLVRALSELHRRGILHNDLHSRNILIRDLKFVKIIDFGKSTLIDDPVVYSIKPGSLKQKQYNKQHRHLAHDRSFHVKVTFTA